MCRQIDLKRLGFGYLFLVPDVEDGEAFVGQMEDHPGQVGGGLGVGEIEDGHVTLGICAAGAGVPVTLREILVVLFAFGQKAGFGFDRLLIEVGDFLVGVEGAREVVELGEVVAEDERRT